MSDLFILAAEPSADLQGAHLIEELLRQKSDLKISALAGPRMRDLPIASWAKMETLQVMGFWDVFLALPRIAQQFFQLRDHLLKLNPKAIVCIDYPGFNLRLEKALRKRGYKGKLIHYICPSVWAWGKKRIYSMEKNLDLLLSIFPFEKSCFSQTKLPVEYVGHPLVEAIKTRTPSPSFRQMYSLAGGPILGLFPGSRKTEIEKNLPLQLQAAKKLLEIEPTLQIAISVSSKDREAQVWSLAGLKAVCIPPEHNYDLMASCHLALATSGTVTLELALHKVPTIVMYAIKPLDLFLAQKIFRINLPFYCITNIIANQRIYPELFGPHLTPETLFEAASQMLSSFSSRLACQKGCEKVQELLGSAPASRLAAKKILQLII
ncbi:MAG: lipid-A-disaccharide synthase [Chlamydiae bacterium]|nr:lipid-A-disaccharide synthase [Chlamydiota bacterium]